MTQSECVSSGLQVLSRQSLPAAATPLSAAPASCLYSHPSSVTGSVPTTEFSPQHADMSGFGHSLLCSACCHSPRVLPCPGWSVLLNLAAAALVSCDLMSLVAPSGSPGCLAALISEFSADSGHWSVSLPPPSGLCSPHTSILILAGAPCCCLGLCVLHSVSSCQGKLFLHGNTAASPCLDFLSSLLLWPARPARSPSLSSVSLSVCCDGSTVLSQPVSLSPWQDLYTPSSLSSPCPS